ncbi:thiol reductase thioredoxin [Sutcliffiella horikoshii]|uniref:Thiol reductase thioredoxin n=1 Tax=Sutcliffiella horikoshii TaxID=79883 RepID=A0ABM6KNB2_9BACI|nr:thioredoxin family protein [Sutcliffiella horikoshii]ART77909.1 thiol reductase thioredoxin [Sutcliffiella horikoshii]
MKDWTKKELLQEINKNKRSVVYFYTPMCGTCQVAKRMMDVTKELFPHLPFGMLDVNYIQDLAMTWEIESVPCMMIFENGEIKEKIYAFRSVEYLYGLIKQYDGKSVN